MPKPPSVHPPEPSRGKSAGPPAPKPTITEELSQLDMFGLAETMDTSYEVVKAPLGELGGRGLPRLLKKPNVAIHVYPVKGRYSMVMRRLFNALLALAHTTLKHMPQGTAEDSVRAQKVIRFEASGADIKRLIGQENKGDYEGLYEMLDALMSLRVVWDALSAEGEHWTKTTTFVSQWERSQDSGKIAWAWMPDLFGMLFDPDNPYTPLDLELARKFNSKYTLALYENCFRYRKIQHTPWRPTRDWVLLIAGPDLYRDYREFKRTALKKAMAELEQTPSCSIIVELEEERGMFNKVERMRFVIKDKTQEPLGFETPVAVNQSLENKLTKLGVADSMVRKLLREHDHAYVEAQAEMTLREVSKGRVKNPAAWLVRAVEERYEGQIAEYEKKTQKAIENGRQQEAAAALEAEFKNHRIKVALEWLGNLSMARQEELEKEFLAQTNATTRTRFEKDGFKSKMVESSFRIWLCKQEGVCTGLDTKDLAGYLATRPAAKT